MNKYQLALNEVIKFMGREDCAGIYSKHYQGSAEDVLMELVERATPKKPIEKTLIRNDNYRDGTNIPRYDLWCPNCNLEHISANDIRYCPSCGQKIDWSAY
ncbi:MAG: hypothetical protein PUF50_03085 [Erysipelotrichaceae bacterium]|nr:hypothetical protein [Erysipelotrichaceae bacterium]